MPAKKRKGSGTTRPDTLGVSLSDTQKVVRLLAMLAIKGEAQSERIKILQGSGFSNTEIADMLGMKPNAVSQAIHRLRTKT